MASVGKEQALRIVGVIVNVWRMFLDSVGLANLRSASLVRTSFWLQEGQDATVLLTDPAPSPQPGRARTWWVLTCCCLQSPGVLRTRKVTGDRVLRDTWVFHRCLLAASAESWMSRLAWAKALSCPRAAREYWNV